MAMMEDKAIKMEAIMMMNDPQQPINMDSIKENNREIMQESMLNTNTQDLINMKNNTV